MITIAAINGHGKFRIARHALPRNWFVLPAVCWFSFRRRIHDGITLWLQIDYGWQSLVLHERSKRLPPLRKIHPLIKSLAKIDFGAPMPPFFARLLHLRLSNARSANVLRKTLLGHRFTAPELLEEGIVDEIVPGKQLQERAIAFGNEIGQKSKGGSWGEMKVRPLLQWQKAAVIGHSFLFNSEVRLPWCRLGRNIGDRTTHAPRPGQGILQAHAGEGIVQAWRYRRED
jgi:hypothetical protein